MVVCIISAEVDDISDISKKLTSMEQILGDSKPKIGAHGNHIIFSHQIFLEH